ncbi:alpha/beta hydrolase-fold protein [Aureivirga sp. CE67]|uniref:alpha/beta hydrolase-fold protein n=1 Tax=Aureivirga sp. CE67 TaxID=1788983 RepID=UPI0018C9505E|nr:alpha/beta hydrolase-fold protein [Aureivirga sp. CE67]
MKKLKYLLILFLCFSINSFSQNKEEYLISIGKKESIYSEILKENRDFYVQLPQNYDMSKKYPVVYILDGEMILPTVVDVHQYYSGGFFPEMILVGISNQENRVRDLTISKVEKLYGMPLADESGKALVFADFLEKELIPHIENKYAATNYRTLIGHSYGGLFTLNTLLHKPHLFENYIAIDPSLDWDNQKLVKDFKQNKKNLNLEEKSVFISLGGQLHMQNSNITIDNVMEDKSEMTIFARSNIQLKEILEQNCPKMNLDWKFYKRDLHGTIPFPSIMDGMIANFEWYQMENTDKFNSFETSTKELKKIIEHRAKKLKSHFKYDVAPYPEDLLNALGYMSMDVGQNMKSKMYFEYAIQFYPESPNVYDSYAEYYERNNNFKKALEYVKKAYELSNSDYHKKRIAHFEEKLKTN